MEPVRVDDFFFLNSGFNSTSTPTQKLMQLQQRMIWCLLLSDKPPGTRTVGRWRSTSGASALGDLAMKPEAILKSLPTKVLSCFLPLQF